MSCASSDSICAGQTISVAFLKDWDNPGFGTPWDLSNVGNAGLDLIPDDKSLFQRELEVVGAEGAERVGSRCRRAQREHGLHCR